MIKRCTGFTVMPVLIFLKVIIDTSRFIKCIFTYAKRYSIVTPYEPLSGVKTIFFLIVLSKYIDIPRKTVIFCCSKFLVYFFFYIIVAITQRWSSPRAKIQSHTVTDANLWTMLGKVCVIIFCLSSNAHFFLHFYKINIFFLKEIWNKAWNYI